LDEIREYGANVHPTVKPIGLMRYLVRLVTPAGGTVLDPFAGSGTTLVAAQIEGCRWIGMELETNHGLICYLRAKHWAENPPEDAKPLGVPYKKPAPTKKKIVLKSPQDASVSVGARFRKPHSSDFFGKSCALNEKDGKTTYKAGNEEQRFCGPMKTSASASISASKDEISINEINPRDQKLLTIRGNLNARHNRISNLKIAHHKHIRERFRIPKRSFRTNRQPII
jgi:hypothetical protein